MNYMPIFLNIEDKEFLVIGGGNVATEKIKRILRFTDKITVISPKITQELNDLIKERSIRYIQEEYKPEIIKDYDIVIVAISDVELQKEI